jgi:hypothetical protein
MVHMRVIELGAYEGNGRRGSVGGVIEWHLGAAVSVKRVLKNIGGEFKEKISNSNPFSPHA